MCSGNTGDASSEEPARGRQDGRELLGNKLLFVEFNIFLFFVERISMTQ
jgi:hypothetical protein